MLQPAFPKEGRELIGLLVWYIENTRNVIVATRKTNEALAKQGTEKKFRDRQIRNVYDRFIRNCAGFLGLSKGSFSQCRGMLYYEEKLFEDIKKDPEARMKETTIEHVVSVGQIREKLFPWKKNKKIKSQDFIKAILCPVALISQKSAKSLPQKNKDWPEVPFERYRGKGINIVTFDGAIVDFNKWTWKQHWKLVDKVKELDPMRKKFKLKSF